MIGWSAVAPGKGRFLGWPRPGCGWLSGFRVTQRRAPGRRDAGPPVPIKSPWLAGWFGEERRLPVRSIHPGSAGNLLSLRPSRAQQGHSLALAFRRCAFTQGERIAFTRIEVLQAGPRAAEAMRGAWVARRGRRGCARWSSRAVSVVRPQQAWETLRCGGRPRVADIRVVSRQLSRQQVPCPSKGRYASWRSRISVTGTPATGHEPPLRIRSPRPCPGRSVGGSVRAGGLRDDNQQCRRCRPRLYCKRPDRF